MAGAESPLEELGRSCCCQPARGCCAQSRPLQPSCTGDMQARPLGVPLQNQPEAQACLTRQSPTAPCFAPLARGVRQPGRNGGEKVLSAPQQGAHCKGGEATVKSIKALAEVKAGALAAWRSSLRLSAAASGSREAGGSRQPAPAELCHMATISGVPKCALASGWLFAAAFLEFG